VAAWQWYQSKEEIGAVRMVYDRAWQWQRWPGGSGLNICRELSDFAIFAH
jgi:hypothetical protein